MEKLSGLGMKKIAVGLGFGVGLTEDGEMYTWGNGPKVVNQKDLVLYRVYEKGNQLTCEICLSTVYYAHDGRERNGNTDLYICSFCCKYNSYTMTNLPPRGVKVKVFVSKSTILGCSQCRKCCTKLKVGIYELNYCKPCGLLQEGEATIQAPPRKMLSRILDVDSGLNFFCILTEKREFKIMKWAFPHIQDALIVLPDNQTISSFSCGSAHVAVVTNSGALYSYGDCHYEKMVEQPTDGFAPITMRKMKFPSSVKKICCGNTAIVCLLMDDSMWIYHKGVQRVIHSFYPSPAEGRKFYSDIVGSVKMGDRFFIKDNTSSVYDLRIHGSGILGSYNCEEDMSNLFLNFQTSFTPDSDSAAKETSVQGEQNLAPQDQSDQQMKEQDQVDKQFSEKCVEHILQDRSKKMPLCITGLYGQQLLSDVTLKLADEEFPAHRMLLFSTSNYFRQLFTNKPLEVLDMSSYNPKAYKALLQHFYQAEVDVLDFEDLMDLYSLAVSYEESDIVKIVTDQLKDHIRFDTVLQLLTKAKSSGNQDLAQECEQFISSPAYKDWLVTAVLQDPSALELALKHAIKTS